MQRGCGLPSLKQKSERQRQIVNKFINFVLPIYVDVKKMTITFSARCDESRQFDRYYGCPEQIITVNNVAEFVPLLTIQSVRHGRVLSLRVLD